MKFTVEMQRKHKSATVHVFGNWSIHVQAEREHVNYTPQPDTKPRTSFFWKNCANHYAKVQHEKRTGRARSTLSTMHDKGGVFSGIRASFRCRASASIPATARKLVGVCVWGGVWDNDRLSPHSDAEPAALVLIHYLYFPHFADCTYRTQHIHSRRAAEKGYCTSGPGSVQASALSREPKIIKYTSTNT